MTIRENRLPDDEPAILCFIQGLQEFEHRFEPNRRLDADFIPDHWADVQVKAKARGAIFIAEEAGRPVGWAFVLEEAGDLFVRAEERRHGFIAELFVAEAARSRGHGRALIQACAQWSKARDLCVLIINVLAENGKAAAVYARDGFAPYNMNLRRYL